MRRWSSAGLVAALLVTLLSMVGLDVASAAPATTTYSQTQTLPVPPASSFGASAGGDGWDVSLSNDKVYNVFHHNTSVTVACHLQSTGATCWSPKTLKDGSNRNFYGTGHSGTRLDLASGKLYTFATRQDSTGGVVCFDTALADANQNPFCGFTELTPVGGSVYSSWSSISAPMSVGSRWYAFNYPNGVATLHNKLLCFDLATGAACSGQPFAIDFGTAGVGSGGLPPAPPAAIGTRLVIPNASKSRIGCFDTVTNAACGGSWPVTTSSSWGAPYPTTDVSGVITGMCVPSGSDPCFTLTGATKPTPANMTAAITASSVWNGAAVVIGPRVYVPNGNGNKLQCYDYSTTASCAGFPKVPSGLSLLYTVNADPQRPTCLWVNADNGTKQIQNLDAYTGGPCGQGSIRVLASQFVVPQVACTPNSYQSLKITSPARDTYTSGSVEFANGAGNPFGLPAGTLDANGSADLTGLQLNTDTGLPQFQVSLLGSTGSVGQVVVELTWTAAYDPACLAATTVVTKTATSVTSSLAGDGQTGSHIQVLLGAGVVASAGVAGDNAAGASGTVTYSWFSDAACTVSASATSAQSILLPGQVPASAAVVLPKGTYQLVASYSGDRGNLASTTACGNASVKVVPPDSTAPVVTASASTEPNGNGWYKGDVTVTFTCVDEVGGSGVPAGTCPAPQVLTGEGSAIASTPVTVTDEAGNVSDPSNVVTVSIDRTAPTVTAVAAPVAPISGWNTGDVTVTFSCEDEVGGSGIPAGTCPVAQVLHGDTTSISSSAVTVTDAAGNVSAPSGVATARIDGTAPVITFTGKSDYSLLDTVAITCAVSDVTSGLVSSTCPSASGPAWSFGPGSHTLAATAVDAAGNTVSVSQSFTITASTSTLGDLIASFTTHNGTRTALNAQLTNFQRSKERGQVTAAAAQLDAFRKGVNDRIGQQFTAAQAALLVAFANTL
jgi:hypothetical protein